MIMSTRDAIKRAINLLGGPVEAARKVGVRRYQTVQQWVVAGIVPAKYCPLIERSLSGAVCCEELNGDIDWGYLRQRVTPSDGAEADAEQEAA